jgi:hypothetical protein
MLAFLSVFRHRKMAITRFSCIINGGVIIDHEAARERRFVAVEK